MWQKWPITNLDQWSQCCCIWCACVMNVIQDIFCVTYVFCSCFIRFSLNLSLLCLYFNIGNFGRSIFVTQLLFGVTEIPAHLLCMWLLEVLGRRILFISTLLTGGLSCILILAVPEGKPIGLVIKMTNSCFCLSGLIFFFFVCCCCVFRMWRCCYMFSCRSTFFPGRGW